MARIMNNIVYWIDRWIERTFFPVEDYFVSASYDHKED